MVLREAFEKIIAIAMNAPSGDNAQPWEFRHTANGVEIFNQDGADATLYNYKQRGSYVAHGALVENIVLYASNEGYSVSVKPFPEGKKSVAELSFSQHFPQEMLLATAIPARTTNRKPYAKNSLALEHKDALKKAAENTYGIHTIWVENREEITKIAHAVSLNEKLLIQNKELHDFFFGLIRWTKEEEEKRSGLYVKTMELPMPVEGMFKYVLPVWPIARTLSLLGLPRIIAAQTQNLYASCSAIGVIVIPKQDNEFFFNAGRVFEHIWLTATRMGLSLQPMVAIPYLAQRIRDGEGSVFSQKHLEQIMLAQKSIEKVCTVSPEQTIAMLFRVGYGEPPTAHSFKKQPYFQA